MTKEFTLDRIGLLMDLLNTLPDEDTIISIIIEEKSRYEKEALGSIGISDVEIHMNQSVNINEIASKLQLDVLIDDDTYVNNRIQKIVCPKHTFNIFRLVPKPGYE